MNEKEYQNLHLFTDTNLLSLNSNLLASIEIRTSGNRPCYDDLVQVAILPLNAQFKPHKGILPFFADIQPKRPQNIELDRTTLPQSELFRIKKDGSDSYFAADLFENWFNKIKFEPLDKKLSIVAHDFVSKRPFLIDWLGIEHFYHFFDYRYRDVMTAALYANDRADFSCSQIPYPKVHLQYLCSQLKVERKGGPGAKNIDILEDCVAIAEVYKRMMGQVF